MYFTEDGSRFYGTFLVGQGGTSDAHPDGVSGVGNTVTLIDLSTH